MAESYSLAPNEAVILKDTSVQHGTGFMRSYTDELILTNLNLICVRKSAFGRTKSVFTFPLNQIKKLDGKPQAVKGELSGGDKTLDIYLINGIEHFQFQTGEKKKINLWINEIYKVITGNPCTDLKEDDSLVGSILGFGKKVKDSLGFKTEEPTSNNVTKKCMSCSAPLTGTKGHTVRCKYCDTDQIL